MEIKFNITKRHNHNLLAMRFVAVVIGLFESATYVRPAQTTFFSWRRLDIHIFQFPDQRGHADLHCLSFAFFIVLLQGLVDLLFSRKTIINFCWLVMHVVVL